MAIIGTLKRADAARDSGHPSSQASRAPNDAPVVLVQRIAPRIYPCAPTAGDTVSIAPPSQVAARRIVRGAL